MKPTTLPTLTAIVFAFALAATNVAGQSPLNKIRIGQCIDKGIDEQSTAAAATERDPVEREKKRRRLNSEALERLIESERRRALVLDVRPAAINQITGKLHFDGDTGQVVVVHMNPFVYKYKIAVAQQELVSSALTDFIDVLLPPGLRQIGRLQSGLAPEAAVRGDLTSLEKLLDNVDRKPCKDPKGPACAALVSMHALYMRIKNEMSSSFTVFTHGTPAGIKNLRDEIAALRDEEVDAYETCERAEDFNSAVDAAELTTHLTALDDAEASLTRVNGLTDSLSSLVDQFTEDPKLKESDERCGGFKCATLFGKYAESVKAVLGAYQTETLPKLRETATTVKVLFDATNKMKEKDGVFARSFPVLKRFEMSEATISISRVNLEKVQDSQQARNEQQPAAPPARPNPTPAVSGRPVNNHVSTANNDDAAAKDGGEDKPDDGKDEGEKKPAAESVKITQAIQIGRPRFLVSGGLVYSPLQRQEFVSASGFVRDASGNPTGDDNKKVVTLGENSPRRLLPMVVLNTRLASFKPASLFFSLGVTAKHDKNIDVEYLLGPSVSMLNDRAMFTFGAYAGKIQSLVPDVKIGDEIPASAGNASLSTQRYSWKPGFSFSYVFSNVSKSGEAALGGGGGDNGAATKQDDLSQEIRIGSVPFNLAMGLAYTSLEDQTFDEVLGLARDRQGNLTNGQNLTRIVGLSASSNSRLVPMAMLHSRLINFGRHSFYLTSGITGKKSDDNIEIEYLVGGTVNIFKRKMFLTFGAFAGKQEALGGDLFPGAKLDPTQDVTKQTRYVWKPAFAFSYDISRITRIGRKQ